MGKVADGCFTTSIPCRKVNHTASSHALEGAYTLCSRNTTIGVSTATDWLSVICALPTARDLPALNAKGRGAGNIQKNVIKSEMHEKGIKVSRARQTFIDPLTHSEEVVEVEVVGSAHKAKEILSRTVTNRLQERLRLKKLKKDLDRLGVRTNIKQHYAKEKGGN